MRRNTLITIVSALSITLIAATTAMAGPGGKRGGKEGRGLGSRMIEALQLSEAQVARIATLKSTRKASTSPVKARIKAQKQQLKTLWSADSPDRAAILAAHAEISSLKTNLVDAKLTYKQGMAATLSPSQLAKMKELKASRHERKKARKAKRADRKANKGPKAGKGRKGGKNGKGLTKAERQARKAARKAGRKGGRGNGGFGGDATPVSE